MDKMDRKCFAAGTNWCKMGDRCTKEIFNYRKETKKKTHIKELLKGRQSLKTQEEIQE
jgi:hypothetical protein